MRHVSLPFGTIAIDLHCTEFPHNQPPLPLSPATCMAGAGGAYTAVNLRNDCISESHNVRSSAHGVPENTLRAKFGFQNKIGENERFVAKRSLGVETKSVQHYGTALWN